MLLDCGQKVVLPAPPEGRTINPVTNVGRRRKAEMSHWQPGRACVIRRSNK
jgi:hypothetical protein